MPAATVRVATGRDGPALAALRRAWAEEQSGGTVDDPGFEEQSGGTVDDPGFEERFARWYDTEAGRRVSWLAEVAGTPVGMVNLAVFSRMPHPGRPPSGWGYLGNAFVLAPYRDRGIGRVLVTALIGYAEREGLVRIVLSPSARSVPFYTRLGFGAADMLLARRSGVQKSPPGQPQVHDGSP